MHTITKDMMAEEVRLKGSLIRAVFPHFSETSFKICNVLLKATKKKKAYTTEIMQVENIHLPCSDGSGEFRCLVYKPLEAVDSVPGILWIHGGGYAIGTPEMDTAFIENFMRTSPCIVVSPDYRLSVDAPYPAALEDCYAALHWLYDNAAGLKVNPRQLFVCGESAGGGLTAAITIYARDKGEIPIAWQMPLYPMLDDRCTGSSENNDAPIWNTKSNEAAWKLYLGSLYGTDNVPVYAAPGRLSEFSGLPPMVTYFGSIEPFYDEINTYIRQLENAGIKVTYKCYEGIFHGFDVVCAKSPQAVDAMEFIAEQYAYAAEHYGRS